MATAASPATPRKADAFDLWLSKQLHELYDQVAREPLPDALLSLIDRDAEALSVSDGVDCINRA